MFWFLLVFVVLSLISYVLFAMSHDHCLDMYVPNSKKEWLIGFVPCGYLFLVLKNKFDSFDK